MITAAPEMPTSLPVTTQATQPTPLGGAQTTPINSSQSTLAPNFASYIYNLLGRGEGLANLPFQEFTGQRFAGTSPLQQQAFTGLGSLGPSQATGAGITATQQALTGLQGLLPYKVGSVSEYMSPYMQNVVDIQAREARRQADIGRTAEQARLTQAGAYGGSRQAIMEAERQRNLNEQIGDIQAKGLQSAYDRAVEQRLKEGDLGIRGLTGQLQGAQTLGTLGQSQFGQGLQALQEQRLAGKEQRQIEQEPLDFGYQQFQESLKYPYQQTTFMQSLLQGLPLATQQPYQAGDSTFGTMTQGGLTGLALYKLLTEGK